MTLLTCSPLVWGTALEYTNAVRAMGMGGAFVSLADDVSAILWNPGGLTAVTRPSILASSALMGENVSQHFLSGAMAIPGWGTAGTYASGILYGSFQRADATGRLLGSFTRSDYSAGLAFSRPLLFPDEVAARAPLSIGITAKFKYADLSSIATAFGVSADVGVLWQVVPGLNFGAAAYNIFGNALNDNLGRVQSLDELRVRSGLSVTSGILADGVATFAAEMESTASRPFNGASFGVESTWGPLALRGGASMDTMGPTRFSVMMGAGWQIAPLALDYAFFQQDFGVQHRMSLGVALGRETPWQILPSLPAAKWSGPITVECTRVEAPPEASRLAILVEEALTIQLKTVSRFRVIAASNGPRTGPVASAGLPGSVRVASADQKPPWRLRARLQRSGSLWTLGVEMDHSSVRGSLRALTMANLSEERLPDACRALIGQFVGDSTAPPGTSSKKKEDPIVAISGFDIPEAQRDAMMRGLRRLTDRLVKEGEFAVLEKGAVDRLKRQLGREGSDRTLSALEAGSLTGARTVLTGQIHNAGRRKYLTIRWLDRGSGELLWGSVTSAESSAALTEALERCATALILER